MPAIAAAHPEVYQGLGLRDLCDRMHEAYRDHDFARAQRDMYTTLPKMVSRPADAYARLVHNQVESVEIDELMGRTVAVMVVPYPPGIPVIMPGEQITADDQVDSGLSGQRARVRHEVPRFRDRRSRAAVRAGPEADAAT